MRSAGIAVAFALVACPPGEATSVRTRVEAATSALHKPASDWCDVTWTQDQAPRLELPDAAALGPSPRRNTWTWLNVWATWCKPCVHEMPLILTLSQHLREDGITLENWFLSVDEDATVVDAFLRSHPELAGSPSYRLRDLDAFAAWTQRYGLAAGTAIPINLLADPEGRVRCVRKSALAEGDYPRIKAVLQPAAGLEGRPGTQ